MVQFLKRLLDLQSYDNVLIMCDGRMYGQLYSPCYPLRVWTCNKLHDSA